MSRKTKKKCQRIHAGNRLEERYNIKYTQAIRDNLINKIRNGGCKFLGRKSNRLSVLSTDIDGQCVIFIYDKMRKEIVTFLLPEHLGNERRYLLEQ